MKPRFFKSQLALRKWFMTNHDTSKEIWVGFYKKNSGKISVSYLDAVDEALCFGWIDGIRKKVDELSYTNRFTPRRPKSTWSKVNIQNVKRLTKAGKMTTAGQEAFQKAKREGRLSYL